MHVYTLSIKITLKSIVKFKLNWLLFSFKPLSHYLLKNFG